ncbi:hypothetical protein LSAT2_001399, partial [Lamellibrachia satsuma]
RPRAEERKGGRAEGRKGGRAEERNGGRAEGRKGCLQCTALIASQRLFTREVIPSFTAGIFKALGTYLQPAKTRVAGTVGHKTCVAGTVVHKTYLAGTVGHKTCELCWITHVGD